MGMSSQGSSIHGTAIKAESQGEKTQHVVQTHYFKVPSIIQLRVKIDKFAPFQEIYIALSYSLSNTADECLGRSNLAQVIETCWRQPKTEKACESI